MANTDRDVAEAVLAYLAECPEATDTAEGITEWWLMREHVRSQAEAVARVLADLVVVGALERVAGSSPPRYRLRRQ